MRKHLVQMLRSSEGDDTPDDAIVRRFWSRARPLRDDGPRTEATVIELRAWLRPRDALPRKRT